MPLASKTIEDATKVALHFPASLAPDMQSTDHRHPAWKKQREENGFDNTELWNLDITFARLMLPRIKAYMEYALFERKPAWKKDMTLIIKALELLSTGDCLFNDKQEKTIHLGINAFARNIRGLWY